MQAECLIYCHPFRHRTAMNMKQYRANTQKDLRVCPREVVFRLY